MKEGCVLRWPSEYLLRGMCLLSIYYMLGSVLRTLHILHLFIAVPILYRGSLGLREMRWLVQRQNSWREPEAGCNLDLSDSRA